MILRERRGRYYVYKLEYEGGKARERYVGPLVDVAETYLKLKDGTGGVGVTHHKPRPGFEPGTSALPGQRSTRLSYRGTR